MRQAILRRLATLCLLGTFAACGGDSSTGPVANNQLTAAEAQLVAANLFVEISKALSTATITTNVAAANQAGAAAPTTFRQTINGTCTAGGTIKGSSVITTDFNSSGSGSQSGSITITSAGCNVSTGTRTIGVDGSFTLTYGVSYANFAPSSNYTWKETGNFTWSGGGCAIDYTAVVTPQGKTSITGSFCGQSISSSS